TAPRRAIGRRGRGRRSRMGWGAPRNRIPTPPSAMTGRALGWCTVSAETLERVDEPPRWIDEGPSVRAQPQNLKPGRRYFDRRSRKHGLVSNSPLFGSFAADVSVENRSPWRQPKWMENNRLS